MHTTVQEVDVIIIGAGPSGTVAASILNEKGYNVKIVEKQIFPRFVVGESLLPRCMDNFEKAGFIDVITKAGFQKKTGARFIKGDAISEFDFSVQFTKGWTWTWQVQRAKFDQLLAMEVESRGVEVEYNANVFDVVFDENGASLLSYVNAKKENCKISGKFLIDASGYGRVLPRLLNLDRPSDFPNRSAIFSHLLPAKPQNDKEINQIAIITYSDSVWAWIIPFSDGTCSVGIVGDQETVDKFPGSQKEKMDQWIKEIPALKAMFSNCGFIFEPRTISGYSSSVSRHFGKGYVLTGNSAEFLDPIFSSGVTFATESSALAAELADRELSGEKVDWQNEYSDYIQRGVEVFKSFIKHWYDGSLQKIIYTQQENKEVKKQICSILAGYVWDRNNPIVEKHKRVIPALAHIVNQD